MVGAGNWSEFETDLIIAGVTYPKRLVAFKRAIVDSHICTLTSGADSSALEVACPPGIEANILESSFCLESQHPFRKKLRWK
jgi:hypothetical protein